MSKAPPDYQRNILSERSDKLKKGRIKRPFLMPIKNSIHERSRIAAFFMREVSTMSKHCSHYDIQYLNERYEYRVIACSIVDHVMTASCLSDGAKILWTVLYRDAALNHSMKCMASTSFLEVKIGKSRATIWRLIKELRASGYLDVENRRLSDGTSLPNIYGPRLPVDVVRNIKKNATKREVVSKKITADQLSGSSRDYEIPYNEPETIEDSVECDCYTDEKLATSTSQINSETFSESTCNNALVSNKSDATERLTSKHSLIYDGHEDERGEGVTNEIQNTITPPTEDYTRTFPHSRDSWKMYSHVRLNLKERLLKMGVREQRAKVLIREIDWTINFGSMQWWTVQKAINVCLSLIAEGRWQSPRLAG